MAIARVCCRVFWVVSLWMSFSVFGSVASPSCDFKMSANLELNEEQSTLILGALFFGSVKEQNEMGKRAVIDLDQILVEGFKIETFEDNPFSFFNLYLQNEEKLIELDQLTNEAGEEIRVLDFLSLDAVVLQSLETQPFLLRFKNKKNGRVAVYSFKNGFCGLESR